MANNSDYMFNKLAGLGEDSCYLSQTEIQNSNTLKYNVHTAGNSIDPAMDLALSNGMNYTGGKNITGLEGSNVEQSNRLLLGSRGTHPHNKLSLRERDYLTVPYLGRGESNVDAENILMLGEAHTENKKSLFPVSEECYGQYCNTPLIKEIEDKITNPEYLVEGTHNNWIRGGLPSRELNRDSQSNN
jgi:hypothetical protein